MCNGDGIRFGLKWTNSKFIVKMTRTKGFRNSKNYPQAWIGGTMKRRKKKFRTRTKCFF